MINKHLKSICLPAILAAVMLLQALSKPVSAFSQNGQSARHKKNIIPFAVTGFAHGFKDSTWLYLEEITKMGMGTVRKVDSAMVLEERFSLVDHTPLEASLRYYLIRTTTFSDYKLLWADNQSLTFSGVKGNFRNALISGSAPQLVSERFERMNLPLEKEIDSLLRHFGTTDSAMWAKTLRLQDTLKQRSAAFVKANAGSLISAYLLSVYCKTWGRRTTAELYAQLPAAHQQSVFGVAVKKFIELNKEVETGSAYADFEQPSPDGVPIRLSSLTGKYLLLEFWASWCGPCRKENPRLAAVYNKYKNRGFEILGVSADKSKTDWIKAITADQLPWPQVSDLNGADNEAALIYGVHSIPANFLIAPDGKIIARDLRGDDLVNKLRQLLGD